MLEENMLLIILIKRHKQVSLYLWEIILNTLQFFWKINGSEIFIYSSKDNSRVNMSGSFKALRLRNYFFWKMILIMFSHCLQNKWAERLWIIVQGIILNNSLLKVSWAEYLFIAMLPILPGSLTWAHIPHCCQLKEEYFAVRFNDHKTPEPQMPVIASRHSRRTKPQGSFW